LAGERKLMIARRTLSSTERVDMLFMAGVDHIRIIAVDQKEYKIRTDWCGNSDEELKI
jgi:hypothetical protein